MITKEIILNIFLMISVIVLVVFLLWFMLGDSPTIEQIVMVAVLPLYLFVFGIYERLNNKILEVKEDLFKQIGETKLTLAKIEGKLNV